MEFTQEEIAKWKEQYGDVYELEVEGHKGYVRKPGRKQLSYATTMASNQGNMNPLVFAEHILSACWLGGDEAIKTNDDLFLAVVPILDEITKRAEATIKKL